MANNPYGKTPETTNPFLNSPQANKRSVRYTPFEPPNAKTPTIIKNEGSRGYAVRSSVYAKYFAYFLTILICSAATNALTSTIPLTTDAGVWMLVSATLILVTAAFSTMAYTNQRNEVIEQARHFVFGIVVFPGLGIAIFMRATAGAFTNINSNIFAGLMVNGLPLVYFATVVIPALIFVKMMAGLRHIHRSRMDDQEQASIWTRNSDGLQR